MPRTFRSPFTQKCLCASQSTFSEVVFFVQALRMLMASCALTRSSFLPDVGVMESHLRPLTQQAMELFNKPCAFDKEDALILALYLQASPLSSL